MEGKVAIEDHVGVGLPVPSVIRPVKVATIEAARAERVGHVPQMTLNKVMEQVCALIGRQGH